MKTSKPLRKTSGTVRRIKRNLIAARRQSLPPLPLRRKKQPSRGRIARPKKKLPQPRRPVKIEPPEEPDFFGLEEAKETKSNSTTSPADASEDPYQDLTLGKELLMAFKTVDKEEKKKKGSKKPSGSTSSSSREKSRTRSRKRKDKGRRKDKSSQRRSKRRRGHERRRTRSTSSSSDWTTSAGRKRRRRR